MCDKPLYAIRRLITIQRPEGQFLDLLENGKRVSRWFSCGEIVPFWGEYDFKRKRNISFLKNPTIEDINYYDNSPDYELLRLRCGQCIKCRLQYSKEWATRIICESVDNSSRGWSNLFITLTYDDDHIHHSTICPNLSTIDYNDLTLFIKRLREYLFRHYKVRNLRYYACGEYGDRTQRSHFHVCLFGLPPEFVEKNKPFSKNFRGEIYYLNDKLSELWGNGFVVCGDLTYQSAAYVARYVCKKLNGPRKVEEFDNLGLENQESRMSTKPGIGYDYFQFYKNQIYSNDEIFLPSIGRVNIPRYFDKLYEFEDPAFLEELKVKRSVSAKLYLDSKLSQTDKNELDYLETELRVLENRVKYLIRADF